MLASSRITTTTAAAAVAQIQCIEHIFPLDNLTIYDGVEKTLLVRRALTMTIETMSVAAAGRCTQFTPTIDDGRYIHAMYLCGVHRAAVQMRAYASQPNQTS